MQQTGTLKKRKRRNIAKVTGLSNLLYMAEEDTFDGMILFNGKINSHFRGGDTRFSMAGLLKHSQSRTNSRITRDAVYYMDPGNYGADDDSHNDLQSRQTTTTLFVSRSVKERPYFLNKQTMSRLRLILILDVVSLALSLCAGMPRSTA
ncbi:unnamed protein product [Orchesella dallaii]|uniref:Uncharacterized protein n=1 Tax=Orchesella dallaii TaxID=48710 RepID=A0ABP1PL30_9HEXA